MSDTLFLLGLLLPPAVVVIGFVALLMPARTHATRRSVVPGLSLRVRPLSH